MCYEYQHKIKSDLKFFDESGTISNVYKLGEKLVELDEVYRKAEAFDEMKRDIFSTIRTLQAEKPRTRDHLIAIGTYQTVLNRMDEYDLDGGDHS